MHVLRISHSAVVDAWRERERELRRQGVTVRLLSAQVWDEGGVPVPLRPREGEDVVGVRTFGIHPALFVYDPRPLWRALSHDWDVLCIHEEPFALATAEVLAIRWLLARLGRGRPDAPFVLYSAQNIYKRYPFPFGWFEGRILRRAGAVSVCSVDAGRNARLKGLRGQVELIPLGIDPVHFSPGDRADADADPTRSAAPGRIRVGYAGRLASHKGVDVLLEAVAGDDRLSLDIAGDGPARHELERAASALGGRVRFLGALGGEDLPGFYRGVDVLAVPSLETPRWIEQFGRVVVEAMACGTPVVASDSGALPEVVQDAGVLVPPGDPDALRGALLSIGTDPALAERLRKRGFEVAERCTWQAVATQYRELYVTLTGGRVARPKQPEATSTTRLAPEVVMVAYGSPELVERALGPLAGGFPITVVDNSSDARIRAATLRIGGHYLDSGRNLGFAGGVNLGLKNRQYPDRDVMLLNPDAVITAEGVRALHAELHARPKVASVGPAQVDGAGATSRVVWPFPHPRGTWLEAAGLGVLRRRQDFVIGSVLLINRRALADVGMLDERFFLYAEETDWAMRAHRLGWRHRLVPSVSAIHLGATSSTDPIRREMQFHASQERFYRKHYGSAGWQINRAAVVVGAFARSVLLTGERRRANRLRLRLYLTGPVRAQQQHDRSQPTTVGPP